MTGIRDFKDDLRESTIKTKEYCQEHGYTLASREDDKMGVDFWDGEGRACDVKHIEGRHNYVIPFEMWSCWYGDDKRAHNIGWLFDPKSKTEMYHFIMPQHEIIRIEGMIIAGHEIGPVERAVRRWEVGRPEWTDERREYVVSKEEMIRMVALAHRHPSVFSHVACPYRPSGEASSRTFYMHEATFRHLISYIRGDRELNPESLRTCHWHMFNSGWWAPANGTTIREFSLDRFVDHPTYQQHFYPILKEHLEEM